MKKLITFILFSTFTFAAFASVSITAASGGTGLDRSISCANGTPGGYASLGDIVITEGNVNDIKAGQSNSTLILLPPTNWQFLADIGNVSITGNDISAI